MLVIVFKQDLLERMRKGYTLQTRRVILCPMSLPDIRCRLRKAEMRTRGWEGGGQSYTRKLRGEWRNNVSYATFPGWCAVGRERMGSSEIPVENGEEWNDKGREREKERERERERERGGKEEKMGGGMEVSLSGMQLGTNTILARAFLFSFWCIFLFSIWNFYAHCSFLFFSMYIYEHFLFSLKKDSDR